MGRDTERRGRENRSGDVDGDKIHGRSPESSLLLLCSVRRYHPYYFPTIFPHHQMTSIHAKSQASILVFRRTESLADNLSKTLPTHGMPRSTAAIVTRRPDDSPERR